MVLQRAHSNTTLSDYRADVLLLSIVLSSLNNKFNNFFWVTTKFYWILCLVGLTKIYVILKLWKK